MKQIQYAGYSTLKDGSIKFRTATDEKRIYQLEAHGEAVCMTLLPKVVTSKSEAAKQLLAINHAGNDPAIVDFYVQNAKDENPFKRKARVVKISVPTTAMVQLTGARVKIENEHGTARERKEANKRLMAQYEAQMAL
jgi:hypothetical protein